MTTPVLPKTLTRRSVFQSASILGAASIIGAPLLPTMLQGETRLGSTVRDRFWLWSHVAGAYSNQYNLVGGSLITPVEAAHYLTIPNVFMVEYNGEPKPEALEQFSVPFRSLQQVAWSIVAPGADGTPADVREKIFDFAFNTPEITGLVMDDFFVHRKKFAPGQVAALSIDELKDVRKSLKRGNKRLDLWAVLYAHQVNSPAFAAMAPYLQLCDVIQIWPWYYGDEISNMEKTFAKVDELVPGKKKALGSFMWNFGKKEPLSLSVVEEQYELGLKWLRSGKIESLIFGASWLCDRKIEAVGFTRDWIRKVGSQKL